MIGFRYHLVSTAAVLFALAAGIVLGTTTLSGPILTGLNRTSASLSRSNQALSGRVSALTSARASDQQFIAAIAPLAASGRLAGRTVVLVAAPGVSAGERAGVVSLLGAAGGVLTSQISLTAQWLDPSRDALLSSLAARLAGGRLPAGTGAAQAGAELADVLVSRPGAPAPSGAALADVVSAFQQAGLLDVSNPPRGPAQLAVVLAPARLPGAGSGPAAGDVLDLAAALAARSSAAVLAAPSGASAGGGALAGAAGVSGTPPVVTGDEAAAGQLSAVLTLARALGH